MSKLAEQKKSDYHIVCPLVHYASKQLRALMISAK